MANHKSAEKRARQIKKRNARNSFIRSTMRTTIKKVRATAEAGKKDEATAALEEAVRTIDKAASKKVVHPKNASRKISRLTRLVNKLQASE